MSTVSPDPAAPAAAEPCVLLQVSPKRTLTYRTTREWSDAIIGVLDLWPLTHGRSPKPTIERAIDLLASHFPDIRSHVTVTEQPTKGGIRGFSADTVIATEHAFALDAAAGRVGVRAPMATPTPPSEPYGYIPRSRTAFVAYPAQVLDHSILDAMGLVFGTRLQESPPKVVMSQGDWDRLVAAIRATKGAALKRPNAPHRALLFLGTSWEDNPLMQRPRGVPPKRIRPYRPKKPSPFVHLIALPTAEALARAQADHEARVQAGEDVEESLKLLRRALAAIRRAATG